MESGVGESKKYLLFELFLYVRIFVISSFVVINFGLL